MNVRLSGKDGLISAGNPGVCPEAKDLQTSHWHWLVDQLWCLGAITPVEKCPQAEGYEGSRCHCVRKMVGKGWAYCCCRGSEDAGNPNWGWWSTSQPLGLVDQLWCLGATTPVEKWPWRSRASGREVAKIRGESHWKEISSLYNGDARTADKAIFFRIFGDFLLTQMFRKTWIFLVFSFESNW